MRLTSKLTKSWKELDAFEPLVIEEIYRLSNSQDSSILELKKNKENGLDKLSRMELFEITRRLSWKEKVVNVDNKRNYPKREPINERLRNSEFLADSDLITIPPNENEPIHLTVLPTFKNWYALYLLKKNQKLEDLDLLHIENVYNTVLDIAERLQINPSTTVKIKLNQECRFPLLDEKCDGLLHSAEYRRDALTYLAQKDIITDVKVQYSEYGDNTVDVSLNLDKFQQFKNEIAKVYENKGKGGHSNNETFYTVAYNEMTGEILINDKVFKKTNLDSIVDNVFTFLNKNPNRKITISELKKATGKTIKDLPKVIENAGFTGNKLRAFFRVSKDAIFFRPQITKTDLEKRNITSLD